MRFVASSGTACFVEYLIVTSDVRCRHRRQSLAHDHTSKTPQVSHIFLQSRDRCPCELMFFQVSPKRVVKLKGEFYPVRAFVQAKMGCLKEEYLKIADKERTDFYKSLVWYTWRGSNPQPSAPEAETNPFPHPSVTTPLLT